MKIASILLLLLPLGSFAQSFSSIESVEYDPVNEQWLVSNGNSIIADDGLGNLSFFGSATASHGMEAVNGLLYAIGNNVIRVYDLETEELVSTLNISGSNFLNGMTSDGASRLWVTDFGNGKIHEIDISNPAELSSTNVATTSGSPNGIVFDEENNRCVFVMWGTNAAIREMDLTDYTLNTILSTGLGNLDGIDRDAEGNYYVSSWSPTRITRYNSSLQNPETIISMGLSSPADICFSTEINTLAVPNSGNETVTYWGLPVSIESVGQEESLFRVYPNPVADYLSIEFSKSHSFHHIQILDQQGALVFQHSNSEFPDRIACEEWAPGLYFIQVETELGLKSGRFIKQ